MTSVTTTRRRLYERSSRICEICAAARATNVQHRKNVSQGGEWALSNLLDLCGSGTTGCHGKIHANPTRAYANGWSVRQPFDPQDIPALLRTADGWHYVWLRDDGATDRADLSELAALIGAGRSIDPSRSGP